MLCGPLLNWLKSCIFMKKSLQMLQNLVSRSAFGRRFQKWKIWKNGPSYLAHFWMWWFICRKKTPESAKFLCEVLVWQKNVQKLGKSHSPLTTSPFPTNKTEDRLQDCTHCLQMYEQHSSKVHYKMPQDQRSALTHTAQWPRLFSPLSTSCTHLQKNRAQFQLLWTICLELSALWTKNSDRCFGF